MLIILATISFFSLKNSKVYYEEHKSNKYVKGDFVKAKIGDLKSYYIKPVNKIKSIFHSIFAVELCSKCKSDTCFFCRCHGVVVRLG